MRDAQKTENNIILVQSVMDKLSPEVINAIAPEMPNEPQQVYAQILINNKLIVSGFEYPIDIVDLIKSTKSSGKYYFWTCHCGVPMCAFNFLLLRNLRLYLN